MDPEITLTLRVSCADCGAPLEVVSTSEQKDRHGGHVPLLRVSPCLSCLADIDAAKEKATLERVVALAS